MAHVGSLHSDVADGVTKTLAGMVAHLPSHGIDTEVWEFVSDATAIEEARIEGVSVWRIPELSRKRLPLVSPTKSKIFRAHAQRREVDLLHLHSVFRVPNIWAAQSGLPYVLTPNGGYSPGVLQGRRRWLKRIWIKAFEQRLWSRARFIHAVSEGEAAELARLPGMPPIVVVANGVNSDLTDKPAIARTKGSWLFVGRLSIKQKGLDLLLRAYATAKLSCPVPALRIIGPDFRGEEKRLRALASDLDLSTNVVFAGPLFGEEKRRAIEAAALLIQPSRWEGMPFSVLEAMAVGTPVVVSGGTNLASSVAGGNAGWTCDS
ncbi:MAG TPA: glycosyltransferase, partial [Chthoniobacteraceae bacterium]|nr:glycosyltransferase [Chthoniobacteraceae bacterium]